MYDLFDSFYPPCVLVDGEEPFVIFLFETDLMYSKVVVIEIAIIMILILILVLILIIIRLSPTMCLIEMLTLFEQPPVILFCF